MMRLNVFESPSFPEPDFLTDPFMVDVKPTKRNFTFPIFAMRNSSTFFMVLFPFVMRDFDVPRLGLMPPFLGCLPRVSTQNGGKTGSKLSKNALEPTSIYGVKQGLFSHTPNLNNINSYNRLFQSSL